MGGAVGVRGDGGTKLLTKVQGIVYTLHSCRAPLLDETVVGLCVPAGLEKGVHGDGGGGARRVGLGGGRRYLPVICRRRSTSSSCHTSAPGG